MYFGTKSVFIKKIASTKYHPHLTFEGLLFKLYRKHFCEKSFWVNEKYEKGSKEYIQHVVEIHLQNGLVSFEVKHKTSNWMCVLLNIMPRVITQVFTIWDKSKSISCITRYKFHGWIRIMQNISLFCHDMYFLTLK